MNAIPIDVAILGAGGAGYPGAFLLAKSGRSVMMVDPIGNLGGDCLAEGCVPSKAVRESGMARAAAAKHKFFGLSGATPDTNWPAVLAHKNLVQNTRYRQHGEEIRASAIIFHQGRGRILTDHSVEVQTISGETILYEYRNLIIGTGSRPHILPIPGAELALTSHHLFRLGADLPLPRRPIVIGGGYIGLETASMLQHLGAECMVLEATGQLVPGVDAGLAQFLHEALRQRMKIFLDSKVGSIQKNPSGLTVTYEQDGIERHVEGDAVLLATGREPALPEGLAALGLADHGSIAVGNDLRTELPHIYAPGDVNGRSMLFHSAVQQSRIAAHNILAGGQATQRMNFLSVPFTVFTEPEVAWVGLSEDAARKHFDQVGAARYDYRTDSRAQIFGETNGFIQLVFDTGTSRLLGAQVAGMDAAHLIAPLALAVQQGSTAKTLTSVPFPHPMIAEGINRAARDFCP
ncbi:MAG: dihydrolipoyl dehydrogenase [Acidobacteriaceae bacterium]